MRNRSVTYSTPRSHRSHLPGPRRPHPPRRPRSPAPRQPACRTNRRAFPVSRPAISKHLRLLRRAHLVREHREGRHRVYELNPEPLRAVDSWIEQYRSFWSASLANLKAFVESEHAREMQIPANRNP